MVILFFCALIETTGIIEYEYYTVELVPWAKQVVLLIQWQQQ